MTLEEKKTDYLNKMYQVIGAAMEVYNELGYGLAEPIYQECLSIACAEKGIPWEREKPLKMFYRGQELNKKYIADFKDDKLEKFVDGIIALNKVIAGDDSLGSGFCIGHSYLCDLGDKYDLESIAEYDIIPMLREYWFDNNDRFNLEAQNLRDTL